MLNELSFFDGTRNGARGIKRGGDRGGTRGGVVLGLWSTMVESIGCRENSFCVGPVFLFWESPNECGFW